MKPAITQLSELAMSFILKGKLFLDISSLSDDGVLGKTKWYEELKEKRLKAKKVGDRTVISVWDLVEWFEALPDYEPSLLTGPVAERIHTQKKRRAEPELVPLHSPDPKNVPQSE